MKAAPRIFRVVKSRRVRAGAALFLAAWQAGAFAVAGVARLAGAGTGRPEQSAAERAFVSSLTGPDEGARQESLREVGALRGAHASAVGIWHAALGRILKGEDAAAVLKDLEREAPRSHHFFDGHTRWLLSDFWRRDRATMLYTAAGYGYAEDHLLEALAALGRDGSHANSSEEMRAATAHGLALILRGRFAEALAVVEGSRHNLFDEDEARAAECLRRLAARPDDFAARLELADAVFSFSRLAAVGYASLCWGLWDEARAPVEQVAVLRLLARAFEQDQSYTTARVFYVAAARLSAAGGVDDETRAAAVAGVADMEARRGGELDAEREPGSALLAAEIYGVAAESFPASRTRAHCLFNRGLLLRREGYAESAERVMLSLIESRADDRDPGGTLMQEFQNYRYNAAREIALSYSDRGDFLKAYDWHRRAGEYSFHSSCGNEIDWHAGRQRGDLFWASLKAGPLFVVWNGLRAVVNF